MINVQKGDRNGDDNDDDRYNYCVFGHYPSSCIYLKHMFQRLDTVSIFRRNLLTWANSLSL
jgi:hypothetical protein